MIVRVLVCRFVGGWSFTVEAQNTLIYMQIILCAAQLGSSSSSVTECDWHSDAVGVDALCLCGCKGRGCMLNARGEIMLWH